MKLLGACVLGGLLVGAAGCPNSAHNESNTALNRGNKELGQKQYDSAIADFQKAVDRYPENHLAWYGMGLAQLEKKDYDKSSTALQHTVELVPDQAMYNMFYGIALFDKAVDDAADAEARKLGKKKEEITDPDLSSVSFEKAQQFLSQAVKLNPELWRAHYFLGKIYRAGDKAKEAAEEFTAAIKDNPREWAPYVALGELYLKWDYVDQAIQVAAQGTMAVPGSNEVSDVWYVLGMGYDAKRMDDKAIDAFSKAIESRRDNHQAVFQRGQVYFRKNDMDNAKKDLEDFSKSSGASLDFAKQQASKMLMDIAAKAAGVPQPGDQKQSPEDLVKQSKGKKK